MRMIPDQGWIIYCNRMDNGQQWACIQQQLHLALSMKCCYSNVESIGDSQSILAQGTEGEPRLV
jgi:hypothetical protein